MQINLPDHPRILSKATSAGFASVEEYVRHLIEEDAGPLDPQAAQANGGQELSYANWKLQFDELLASLEPGNPNFDDSRESIYPAR
jgi:hypothetical protein